MPKYLFIGSYTAQGAKGLLKDGGSKRRQAAIEVIESVGGSMESFYYGFGADDFYLIADFPDHASVSAASLTVGASGAIAIRTVVLMTPEELDAASRMSPHYTPPGA